MSRFLRTAVQASPLALLLSGFAVVGRRIRYDEWLGARPDRVFIEPLGPADALLWAAGGVLLAAALAALPVLYRAVGRARAMFRHPGQTPVRIRWWPMWSAGIFCAWVPYLLLYWPGVVLPDSFASIGPMLGERPLENHHPLAFTLFVGVFLHAGAFLGLSVTSSIALFSLTQMAIMATALGYACLWLTRRTHATVVTASAVAAFFAFTPVFAIYAINVQKDPLFAVAIMLLCLLLSDAAATNDGLRNPWTIARLALLAAWVSLWRNGGTVIVAACAVLLIFVWRRKAARAVLSVLAALLAVTIAVSAAEASGVTPAPQAEKLAVPLQQVARAMYTDGEISEDQAAVLEEVLPVERWRELYTPARVDAIKWAPDFDDEYLDAHTGRFLSVWLAMAPTNLGAYVEAWMLETFGFWAPGVKNGYGFIDTAVAENPFGIERTPRVETLWGLTGDELAERLDYFGSGTLAWILLVSAFGVATSPRRRYVLAYAPLVLVWLAGLAATPTAFSLRYVFSIALAVPLLLLAPLAAHAPPRTPVRGEGPQRAGRLWGSGGGEESTETQ
ncbi:DUF6020 family protein [Microbacterium album]|nr:DUF6020 family protein [Microbacterium album]